MAEQSKASSSDSGDLIGVADIVGNPGAIGR